MTLVEELIAVKEHLSNKERWETCWENNRITGYASGSLGNTLGGIWNSKDNRKYAAAYDCVVKAIVHLFGKLEEKRITRCDLLINDPVKPEYYSIVRAFSERKNHEDLMKVLDLAIRYAKIYIFS